MCQPIRATLACASLALAATGCLPSISDLDTGPLTATFAVSDYYTPSGYMGDGQNFGNLVGQTNQGCKMPRPQGARGNCYVFNYYPNHNDSEPWAGVYWVFPANNWGSTYGHAIDTSKFKQVRFYAAVEGPSPFTVAGAAAGLKMIAGGIKDPQGTFAKNGGVQHIDALNVIKSQTVGSDVTTELKQFHMPISDIDKQFECADGTEFAPNCTAGTDAMGMPTMWANDLIGAFAWALPYPKDAVACADGTTDCRGTNTTSQFVNPQPVKVFLDDIVWDTEPAPPNP